MTFTINTNTSIYNNREKIMRTISNFWNKTSLGWREVWGLHIHHGYYENQETPAEAQEKLIEKILKHIDIKNNFNILDAGCGMGGSSIYLAKKYDAQVTGITLSQKQVEIAKTYAQFENVKHVDFRIDDALTLETIANNSVDLVWSLESCEQFYNKDLFIQQAYRVLKPGGKLMLATWCSDKEEYTGIDAKRYKKLCLAFDLPYMPTIKTYHESLVKGGFSITTEMDWSDSVEKSWDIGISLTQSYSFLKILRLSGWRGFRFVKQIKMMRDAFKDKRVRYGVFVAIKN